MTPDRPFPTHAEAAMQGVLFTISFHEHFLARKQALVTENGVCSSIKDGLVHVGLMDTGEALLMDSQGLWRAPLSTSRLPGLRDMKPLRAEDYLDCMPEVMNALANLVE